MPHHKYFYSDLFQLMNVSISGPYVMKLSLIRDGHKAYFVICQHFMCDDLINRKKDKAYLELEALSIAANLNVLHMKLMFLF